MSKRKSLALHIDIAILFAAAAKGLDVGNSVPKIGLVVSRGLTRPATVPGFTPVERKNSEKLVSGCNRLGIHSEVTAEPSKILLKLFSL